MFASKTSHMCNEIERYHIGKKRCLVIKHVIDTRFEEKGDHVITHAGIKHSNVRVISAESITEAIPTAMQYDVIGIDEIQFFYDCAEVQRLANAGKIVICAGLDSDYRGNIFNNMHCLIPLCEDVIKLKAVCVRCGENASFTNRKETDRTDMIGGSDLYEALCRKCKFQN